MHQRGQLDRVASLVIELRVGRPAAAAQCHAETVFGGRRVLVLQGDVQAVGNSQADLRQPIFVPSLRGLGRLLGPGRQSALDGGLFQGAKQLADFRNAVLRGRLAIDLISLGFSSCHRRLRLWILISEVVGHE